MEVIDLFEHPIIQDIVSQYNATKRDKQRAAYNLFTISSYNSYLENFHSDIIASLLNPNGLHQQGDTFLQIFIDMLNEHSHTNILNSDFKNTIVTRETGRIDIWIRDETSRQSIIIENKINNADDMEDQIDRYVTYAESTRKYPVKAVVYLSLEGAKKAPRTKGNFDHLVKNMKAFDYSQSNLVSGWLRPCFHAANNKDSESVIHQYINLIQHLATKNMDSNTMESFYKFINNNDGIGTVKAIIDMYNNINSHRTDKFSDAMTDISPFGRSWRYRSNYWLCEGYSVGESSFKLDVWFDSDGSATIVFWDTELPGEEGRIALTEKLNAINSLHEFNDEILYGNGYPKYFKIGEIYKTMANVDDAITDFVKKFLSDLRNS